MLMVAFDLSALVRLITRFTEECFSVLISLIFIVEAFSKAFSINDKYTILRHPGPSEACHCELPSCENVEEWKIINGTGCLNVYNTTISFVNDTINFRKDCLNFERELIVNKHLCISDSDCTKYGGNLTGPTCTTDVNQAMPDVFLLSLFLFFMTFGVAYALAMFRNSRFLSNFVSKINFILDLQHIHSLTFL